MNPKLDLLHPYPFERLKALMAGIVPPAHLSPIALSIGEPKHQSPAFVKQALIDNVDQIAIYPTTKGRQPLRQAIHNGAQTRFKLPSNSIDPEQNVLPVTGTGKRYLPSLKPWSIPVHRRGHAVSSLTQSVSTKFTREPPSWLVLSCTF